MRKAEPELPPVVQAGDPVLRGFAEAVDPAWISTDACHALVETMVEVMRAAPGVGLAAPQIGVPKRIIVLEDAEALMAKLTPEQRQERGRAPFPLRVIMNPELRVIGERRVTFFEGCLSVAGYAALVERGDEVEVKGLDERGAKVSWRVKGWPARILQHEVDHLNGTLYVDRMLTRTFSANAEALKHWIHLPVDEVRAALLRP